MNGRGTPVGPDVSRPPPMYRPVGNPPHIRHNVLQLTNKYILSRLNERVFDARAGSNQVLT
jgi:hypothetical protein